MRYLRRKSGFPLVVLAAGVLIGSPAGHVAVPGMCDVKLTLELTPDVPNPRAGSFLSSLLSNHPEYRLTVREELDDTHIVVELVGPGPAYRCRKVIESMRRNSQVLSVRVSRGS